ncbi:MAG: PIN domain-containing protein [Solirubrobacterales bacterium]
MALLVDSDLLIDLERDRDAGILEALPDGEALAISVITVSELLHGLHRAGEEFQVRRRAFVDRILAEFEAVPITTLVARVHAEIWAELSSTGNLIGSHDLWIAATGVALDTGVATRNTADFERVSGLRVVSPW